MKTLQELAPGERAYIIAIGAEPYLRRRLMDLGIIEGAEVEMLRTAPMGDPVEIRVHHVCVALRKSEAATILLDARGIGEPVRSRHRHRLGRQSE